VNQDNSRFCADTLLSNEGLRITSQALLEDPHMVDGGDVTGAHSVR